ncbi:MAG: transcriptional regulator [Rhizobiales bacterium 24-66-13]|jgi:predicted transcriptional regulator of viral defense system|nr:MAG: transcriptional regulator [Rhizobiales bacterium 24-66-13]OZB11657.1 MAG: transcriptional regulator [Rhizobiales bacterium 39-66-18]HQS48894.1 type IV toxin-antitoxin system AbiEi family antitoxin domain-containing protein [Xanthobacteraceae bacterium]
MQKKPPTQAERALALLQQRGMIRTSEFSNAGIAATTLSRLKEAGAIVQIARGLYELPDTGFDANRAFAEIAKIAPRSVICLTSALAFHDLTDQIPSRVFVAIGRKDRQPKLSSSRFQFVHFSDAQLRPGVQHHIIHQVPVQIFSPAKTIIDLFRYAQGTGARYRHSPGLSVALEGMREALRTRKTTPSEIAHYATEEGIWKSVAPYLEAMTANA